MKNDLRRLLQIPEPLRQARKPARSSLTLWRPLGTPNVRKLKRHAIATEAANRIIEKALTTSRQIPTRKPGMGGAE